MNIDELKFLIIDNSIPLDRTIQGVYFLIYRNEIVYVGKSNKVHRRIQQHVKNNIIVFDRWYCMKYDDMFIAGQRENEYIKLFKPKYNKEATFKYADMTSPPYEIMNQEQ